MKIRFDQQHGWEGATLVIDDSFGHAHSLTLSIYPDQNGPEAVERQLVRAVRRFFREKAVRRALPRLDDY